MGRPFSGLLTASALGVAPPSMIRIWLVMLRPPQRASNQLSFLPSLGRPVSNQYSGKRTMAASATGRSLPVKRQTDGRVSGGKATAADGAELPEIEFAPAVLDLQRRHGVSRFPGLMARDAPAAPPAS
jgi:hypothetical protein